MPHGLLLDLAHESSPRHDAPGWSLATSLSDDTLSLSLYEATSLRHRCVSPGFPLSSQDMIDGLPSWPWGAGRNLLAARGRPMLLLPRRASGHDAAALASSDPLLTLRATHTKGLTAGAASLNGARPAAKKGAAHQMALSPLAE